MAICGAAVAELPGAVTPLHALSTASFLFAGVQSAKDIVVLVQDTSVSVSVPGRYILVGCINVSTE